MIGNRHFWNNKAFGNKKQGEFRWSWDSLGYPSALYARFPGSGNSSADPVFRTLISLASPNGVLDFRGPEIHPPTPSSGASLFNGPQRRARFPGSGNSSADPIFRCLIFLVFPSGVLDFRGPEIHPPTPSSGPSFFSVPPRSARFPGSGNSSADPLFQILIL